MTFTLKMVIAVSAGTVEGLQQVTMFKPKN